MNTQTDSINSDAVFCPSDSVAIIRTGQNGLEWSPVFLDAANNAFVRKYGEWAPVNGVQNFLRYEPARRKRLFDTSTLEQI